MTSIPPTERICEAINELRDSMCLGHIEPTLNCLRCIASMCAQTILLSAALVKRKDEVRLYLASSTKRVRSSLLSLPSGEPVNAGGEVRFSEIEQKHVHELCERLGLITEQVNTADENQKEDVSAA